MRTVEGENEKKMVKNKSKNKIKTKTNRIGPQPMTVAQCAEGENGKKRGDARNLVAVKTANGSRCYHLGKQKHATLIDAQQRRGFSYIALITTTKKTSIKY